MRLACDGAVGTNTEHGVAALAVAAAVRHMSVQVQIAPLAANCSQSDSRPNRPASSRIRTAGTKA